MLKYLPAVSVEFTIFDTIKAKENVEVIKVIENLFSKINYECLISYGFLGLIKRDGIIKEKYNLGYTLGDSGGFQLVQQKSKKSSLKIDHITPDKVLKWLERECDMGMNLDLPVPFHSLNYEKSFQECLQESVKNFEYFENHRKNIKLYNIVHGKNFDYLERWYDKVKKFNFEGWGLSLFPYTDSLFLSLQLIFMDELLRKNNKKIEDYYLHILGSSSLKCFFILKYFDTYRNVKQITTDSSDHRSGSQFRSIRMPKFNDNKYLFDIDNTLRISFCAGTNEEPNEDNKEGWNEYEDLKKHNYKLPCNCQCCSEWNEKIESLKIDNIVTSTLSVLLSLHNVCMLKNQVDYINAMGTNNPTYFKCYLNEVTPKTDKLYDAIRVQQLYFDEGIEFKKILSRYKDKVEKIGGEGISEYNQFDEDMFL